VKLTLTRTYQADRTTGTLSLDGQSLGATLEDIGRPAGIKIDKETCIPEGSYHVTINHSNRFGRDMILLYSNPADLSCDLGGVRFTGIRIHKGVKTEQTEGCILFQGDLASLESAVAAARGAGETITLEVGR